MDQGELKVRSVKDRGNGLFDFEVEFPWLTAEGFVQYTTSQTDDPYGLHKAALEGAFGPVPLVPLIREITFEAVNAERDRRITEGCVVTVEGLGSIPLQGREKDLRNLQALAFGASLRIAQGDTRTLTTFRDRNNELWELTPPQIIALWQAGAEYVSSVYEVSWMLKYQSPIPTNYAEDHLWPSTTN